MSIKFALSLQWMYACSVAQSFPLLSRLLPDGCTRFPSVWTEEGNQSNTLTKAPTKNNLACWPRDVYRSIIHSLSAI